MSSWFRNYVGKGSEKSSKEFNDEQFVKSQVQEALSNLRNAEMLVNRSIDEKMKRHALEMYQNSLGVLMQVLNSNQTLPKDLKKEVLAQHIHKALTQAERLKESLSPNKPRQKQKKMKPNSPSSTQNSPSSQTTQSAISKSSPHLKNPLYPLISQTIHIPSHALTPLSLSSISGLQSQKQTLQTSLLQPLLHPHLYTGLRTPPSGILLYGPPGTGKTMLIKALAYESRQSTMFFSCTSATLSSKWHGEGEKILWLLFQIAREVAPSIVFLDEMDSLFGRRGSNDHEASRRLKTEFMVQMDGIIGNNNNNGQQNRLWVLGCTNTPWDLDEAILRRMEVRLYVPLPDDTTRRILLQNLLQQNTHNITSSQLTALVKQTKGYSCSDLRGLGREAAFGPLREMNGKIAGNSNSSIKELRPIQYKDFQHAVNVSTRSVSKGLLQQYKNWEEEQSGRVGGK